MQTSRRSGIATAGLAHFDVDPSEIMRVHVAFDDKFAFLSLSELISLMDRMDMVVLKPSFMHYADRHSGAFQWPNRVLVSAYGIGGVFYDLALSSGVPQKKNSAIDCIHRALVLKGKTPRWSLEENVGSSQVFGKLDAIVGSIKSA